MKRRLVSLALSLIILFASVLSVNALSTYVHDSAGLMSDSEVAELEALAEDISGTTGLDLVILTVEQLNGRSPSAYADDYYDSNGYSDDGMLFLLAMAERDWYISTKGKALQAFDDDDIDTLLDVGLPYFSAGLYRQGFCEVLLQVRHMSGHQETSAAPGRQSSAQSSGAPVKTALISVLIGIAVSGIVVLIMRSTMNTKRRQRSAGDYLAPGSYHLRTRQDIFLYSNVTKTPRQQSSGSSHGSSSGRSHGGGGTKF